MKKILLLSGGLDSASILLNLLEDGVGTEDIICIGFNYQQDHVGELIKAKTLATKCGVTYKEVNMEPMTKVGDIYQYRNLLFLIEAHRLAKEFYANTIYIGVCENDQGAFPDCTQKFIDSVQTVLDEGYGCGVAIKTPLISKTKTNTLRYLDSIDKLSFVLDNTMTCYRGTACGECTSCNERNKAIRSYYL